MFTIRKLLCTPMYLSLSHIYILLFCSHNTVYIISQYFQTAIIYFLSAEVAYERVNKYAP